MLVVRLEVGAKQDVRSMIVYAGPPSWTVEVMRALYGTPSSDSGSDVFDWLIRLELARLSGLSCVSLYVAYEVSLDMWVC